MLSLTSNLIVPSNPAVLIDICFMSILFFAYRLPSHPGRGQNRFAREAALRSWPHLVSFILEGRAARLPMLAKWHHAQHKRRVAGKTKRIQKEPPPMVGVALVFRFKSLVLGIESMNGRKETHPSTHY